MKKLSILLVGLLLIFGCTKKEKSVVCTMDSTEELKVSTEYFYDDNDVMTRMIETNVLTLSKEDLKENTIEEYMEDLKTLELYEKATVAKGVTLDFSCDKEKNQIFVKVEIDFNRYDYVVDLFSLGEKENFEDIHFYIDALTAYGMSTCGEVK